MEKSSQIAWKIVPLRHFFPLKVVPLIEVLLYFNPRICFGSFRNYRNAKGRGKVILTPVLGTTSDSSDAIQFMVYIFFFLLPSQVTLSTLNSTSPSQLTLSNNGLPRLP
jgi:hypothetical protein